MSGNAVAQKRKIKSKAKVKTGCATCRVRKVKCDEHKPSCQRCVSTGRTCDGYESPFRFSNNKSNGNTHIGDIKSDVRLQPIEPTFMEIALQDVELLERYFSIKTMFDVKLGYVKEAREVLEASLTDAPIRHAILSLTTLREDLEMFGDGSVSATQRTPSYHYGLEQYSLALGGLASKLSPPSSDGLRSALLCCQIFISIEQVRKSYAAMAQHIVRGLEIMHEYRARPGFVTSNQLVPAYHDRLPLLDVFIIKMFAAPCKFEDSPATTDASGSTFSTDSDLHHQQPVDSCEFRPIAPNMRAELTRIAMSTLEFLNKVSQVKSVEIALRLLHEKAALLNSLESWLIDVELVQKKREPSSLEPVSISFLRLFHLILKIVLSGALDSSPSLNARLQIENDRLQYIANDVAERVKTYQVCSGISNGHGERSPTQ